jgi:hypothetical protein
MSTMWRFMRRLFAMCCSQRKFQELEALLDGEESEEEEQPKSTDLSASALQDASEPAKANPRPVVMRDDSVNFNQAADDGEVLGITSYNILANPKYARAFQLARDTDETGNVFQSLSDALHLKRVSSEDSAMAAGQGSGGALLSRLQARMRAEKQPAAMEESAPNLLSFTNNASSGANKASKKKAKKEKKKTELMMLSGDNV